MRNTRFRKYIYWGVTMLIVVLTSASFVMGLTHYSYVDSVLDMIHNTMSPIIYGAILSFLLAPIYNRTYLLCVNGLAKLLPSESTRKKIGNFLGTLISIVVLIAVVTGLISMLIPELLKSILGIVENFPVYVQNLQNWIQEVLRSNPELEEYFINYVSQSSVYIQNWLQNSAMPYLYGALSRMSSGVLTVFSMLKNLIIGLIVMIYVLNMKTLFATQSKMILYSILPVKAANKIVEEGRFVHRVFGGFITGKLLDSLIIGLICFVLLPFMNMPYVLLISVIIGCTNIIPVFGPFIGAVPTSILILLVDPMKCLYFIVFVLLLQMFDGYVLGPKILGGSTGLSSFWVLFSLLVFGGLYGFVGMIIAVPTFAVIYKLITELVMWRLHGRNLSADINDYADLKYIEEESNSYIKKS